MEDKDKQNTDLKNSGNKNIRIVGIGGSAGSAPALEKFFRNLPADLDLAYVVITHTDSTRESRLHEIIKRFTELEVIKITEGMKPVLRKIYVVPSDKMLAIRQQKFRLTKLPEKKGSPHIIDIFLCSLAKEYKENAIAVILSGMGEDGKIGITDIKANNGIVFVQSPDSAIYPGMPENAILTSNVDLATLPENLGKILASVTVNSDDEPGILSGTNEKMNEEALREIFSILAVQTNHDFTQYKKSTLLRRIERRMHINQIHRIEEYVNMLKRLPSEGELLYKELLIGVTDFFRDKPAFDFFSSEIIPMLVKKKDRNFPLKVWIAGCSTGEEAYSVAIAFREYFRMSGIYLKIQIYATDIEKDSIAKARRGIYSKESISSLPVDILNFYFRKDGGEYKIIKEIREMLIFANQNLIMDPPFTKTDLLICRNVLIYLSREIQKKLFRTFHYSLNENGVLFLGSAESLGEYSDLFEIINSKWKFFKKKSGIGIAGQLPDLYFGKNDIEKSDSGHSVFKPDKEILSLPEIAQKMILDIVAPPAVLIDKSGNILYIISGKTGKYLEPAPGKASLNVFLMAKDDLLYEMPGLIRRVSQSNESETIRNVKINSHDRTIHIDVKAFPIKERATGNSAFLIVFYEQPFHEKEVPIPENTGTNTNFRDVINQLEMELRITQENLVTKVQEMEITEEELRSTNEELQSTNEEIQSTNEELTTSKEEMQSLNEELLTVNLELQSRLDELSEAHNDLSNLLNITQIATIFLNKELIIKKFTADVLDVVNLIPTDIGRPITDIVMKIDYKDLVNDIKEVNSSLQVREREILSNTGQWYLMRIIPYKTMDDKIDGVVLTFNNITTLKKLEIVTRKNEQRLLLVLNAMPEMIIALDSRDKVLYWNTECEKITGYSADEMIGFKLYDTFTLDSEGALSESESDKNTDKTISWKLIKKDGTFLKLIWKDMTHSTPIPGWAKWGLAKIID